MPGELNRESAASSSGSTTPGMTMIGATQPLPPGARLIAENEGRWRRWMFDQMLRWTIKRGLRPGAQLGAIRARNVGMDARWAWVEPGMRRTSVVMAGVPCEWIDLPGSRSDRVLFYLHGGAFALRFPCTYAGLVARLCRRLQARALLPDYRLAPEHPHPAGVDDCVAVYHALLGEGLPGRAIAAAGDSAGGNLLLATLQRLRLADEPLPACAVAMSPIVDFTLSAPSIVANALDDPMFTLEGMLAFRHLYAPPERFLDPTVSPLFGDWSGLPPLLFQVGSTEMLRDDAVRCVERALAVGTPVELELYERQPHVFQLFHRLAASGLALDAQAAFIARHTLWNRLP